MPDIVTRTITPHEFRRATGRVPRRRRTAARETRDAARRGIGPHSRGDRARREPLRGGDHQETRVEAVHCRAIATTAVVRRDGRLDATVTCPTAAVLRCTALNGRTPRLSRGRMLARNDWLVVSLLWLFPLRVSNTQSDEIDAEHDDADHGTYTSMLVHRNSRNSGCVSMSRL